MIEFHLISLIPNVTIASIFSQKTKHDRLNIELEEKVHDLAMAQKNIEQLKVMLEEKSTTSESHQQERLQSIAGMTEY